ncbi:PEP-CTERM/exosortase system-associated acyltransferase [Salinicola halophilus]|uniref:PEP-CTERM/exosortase system-associated acyltransferase n=1 Tax=Salinicola halophilus TaxID=184065 RepID=UPI0013A64262|nr:PEP-CTERM/exosortase system-associated acyltransferase [Salinicola halophilus]
MPIHERFWDHFEFVLALTPAQKREVYALRYNVYTGEFGHQMPGAPAQALEFDAFDACALHCLVRDRHTGETVACIRVVSPGSAEAGLATLPVETHAEGYFSHADLIPTKLPRETICEVSRAAILGRYRKRLGGERVEADGCGEPGAIPHAEAIRVASLLGGAVYCASTVMIELVERRHAFALMEPRLARLLGRFGLRFERVGELQPFNGVRAAYYIDQHRARETLKPSLQGFYQRIADTLSAQFAASNRHATATRPDFA